jgi:RNA polymerase sigma-70 factor (ECF subfamily)
MAGGDGGVVAVEADTGVLAAAQAGDEAAFVRLTSPWRGPLHRHCYRLLGSLDDADDALQETLLRAWRGLGGYQPRAPFQAWLHRIATNVCLRILEQRRRAPGAAPDAHLEPYPDSLLAELPSAAPGPDVEVADREQIGLAFVAAVQLLPPRQRIVLVLRDVLDWSAHDVADLLGDSVPSVNSALQRARGTIERERAERTLARVHAPASAAVEARVMRRFQEAWQAVDVPVIVSLLAEDCLLTMPPEGARFEGRAAVGAFFAAVPLDGRLDELPLVAARANRQPALAAYADDGGEGVKRPYGVMVFALDGDLIAGITGFPRASRVFERMGLPRRLG